MREYLSLGVYCSFTMTGSRHSCTMGPAQRCLGWWPFPLWFSLLPACWKHDENTPLTHTLSYMVCESWDCSFGKAEQSESPAEHPSVGWGVCPRALSTAALGKGMGGAEPGEPALGWALMGNAEGLAKLCYAWMSCSSQTSFKEQLGMCCVLRVLGWYSPSLALVCHLAS